MVIAFAGSRMEASTVEEGKVAEEIEAELKKQGATVMVSSAASGADLLALETAGRLEIRRTVVLPFDRATFREKCVMEGPGDWGRRYDAVMDEVKSGGDVVILGYEAGDAKAYTATKDRVLAEARTSALGLADHVAAILVWDGKPGGADDLNAHFLHEAELANVPVTQILSA